MKSLGDLSKGNPILRIITQLDCYLTRNDSQWTLSTSREQANSPSGKLSRDLQRLAWTKGLVKIIKDVCVCVCIHLRNINVSRDYIVESLPTRTSNVLQLPLLGLASCMYTRSNNRVQKENKRGGRGKQEGKKGTKKRQKEFENEMWIAGTIGVHLAGNVQKISLHLYKNEQGLIMERAVRLNSTSLKAKRVRMFQTVTWFLFFPLFSFLLFPSLSYFFVLFFFFNTTSPFAIGSTKNCGTCTALFMTHRLLPLCLVNRWIKTFPSRAISDVRFSLSLSFFSVIICLH